MKKQFLYPILIFFLIISACKETSKSGPETEESPTIVDTTVKTRIDSTLQHFVDSGNISGVSALIYENGQEVYYMLSAWPTARPRNQ